MNVRIRSSCPFALLLALALSCAASAGPPRSGVAPPAPEPGSVSAHGSCSALRATELVLDLLQRHGMSEGRVELLDLSARPVSEGSDRVSVRLEAIFEGEDALTSTRTYEGFADDLERLPGVVRLVPASTSELEDGKSTRVQGLAVELALPARQLDPSANDLDYAIRAAAVDDVGPVEIRVLDGDSGDGRRPARPERKILPVDRYRGRELSVVRAFLADLEEGPPSACVVALDLHATDDQGEIAPDVPRFRFETRIAPRN